MPRDGLGFVNMTVALLLLSLAIGLSLIMTFAFFVVDRGGKSGWVDATWTFGTGLMGVVGALVPISSGDWAPRQFGVAALAAIWSLRLGLHIVMRTKKGGDDPRYAQLRSDWGANFRAHFFWFLQVQAASALLLDIAIAAAAHNPTPHVEAKDAAAILVLVIAVVGEAIADRQLSAFRNANQGNGRVCDTGLWAHSRHPNYFFEWLGWFAYAIVAIDLNGHYPWGYAALIGPAFMYWLLVHVSGIPPLEAHMLRARPQAFRSYQQRVNAFWLGPAKSEKER